jgi:hypothetical protein
MEMGGSIAAKLDDRNTTSSSAGKSINPVSHISRGNGQVRIEDFD